MHDKDANHISVQGGVKAAESQGKTNSRGGVMAKRGRGHKVGKKYGKKKGHKK